MKIQEALKHMEDKNLDLMKENFHRAITQKAVEKLEEMKQQIAADMLGKK